jgi:hypothetical protein
MIVGFPRWGKYIARLIFVVLVFVILFGCSQKTKNDAIQATITITNIVDKATQRPINSNVVTLRWETPKGKVIKTETYRNQSQLTTTMPADVSVRLFIAVEAPGYVKWENAYRMKFNTSKPVSFPVEMERVKGMQG